MTSRRLIASYIVAALLAFTALAGDPPGTGGAGSGRVHPTVEPTLPLLVEARFEEIERRPGATSGLLVIEIVGQDDVRDLVLEATLPAGLVPARPDWLPRSPMSLRRGEARRIVVPVDATGSAGHAVRLLATFRDPSGRALSLGQGVTLDAAIAPAGRSHLGAFEVMAVPIEELVR